jgi:hypothetical protein
MRRWLGVLGVFSALAGAAAAQTGPGGAHLVGGFTQLFISPCGEPYRGRAGDPYPVALWFKQADLNHDGVIDRAEFRADHTGFFDALDADGDGILDGTEVGFYEHKVAPDVFGAPTPRFGALTRPGRDGAQLILIQGTGIPHADQGPIPGQEGVHGPAGGLNAQRPRPVQPLEGAAAYGLLREP